MFICQLEMKILLIDNYDSFTYNLLHYIEKVSEHEVIVVRNDSIGIAAVAQFDKIMISPGPGLPTNAGIIKEVIRTYADSKSILGICLGHQAIGEVFGGKLRNLQTVQHGVTSAINCIHGEPFFAGIPDRIEVGRYHSWVIDENNLPKELMVTATDDDGVIMAVRHRKFDVCGVQFHPESIMTTHGLQMIDNWVNRQRTLQT